MRTGADQAAAAARRRLLRANALRAVMASALLGAAFALRVDASPLPGGVDAFFGLTAITYALTGLWAATWRLTERRPWLADIHFAGDILVVSGLVLYTGGAGSLFVSLYALPIVAAGVVRQRRGSLAAATFAMLCYGVLVMTQYSAPLGRFHLPGLRLPFDEALSRVVINAAGFAAIGVLTGWLAEERARADARLAHASSAIADLQAFNQRIVDSLPGGLLTTDERGVVVSANRAAGIIIEAGSASCLGLRAEQVLQLDPDCYRRLDAGEVRRIEYEFLKPSARRIVLGLGIAPLGADGGTRGYLFTFQDVTEAKRREHEAQVQKRLAAVGEMAAGIAHEIRNPLASMAGSIQVLRRDLPLDADQAVLMDIVLRESQRLNDTIRNFLSYARPQRPSPARVDLGTLLEEIATLLRNSPDLQPGHAIHLNLGEVGLACQGDQAQLRQVVWNLAGNALRAMPGGGTLSLGLTREGDRAVLSVTDTGHGMSAEQRERLFQPFQSEFANGTGLGLAIAHRIVTDHGGTILVESVVGQGTVVRVGLPEVVGGWQLAVGSEAHKPEEAA